MTKRWIIRKYDVNLQRMFSRQLGIPALLAQLLINRELDNPEAASKFLNPRIDDFLNPWDLPDIKKAVSRIKRALQNKESILICGDYDVDGISACAILNKILRGAEADIQYYIPHRIKEGYGISKEAVRLAKEQKKTLVISVDCGISDYEELAELKKAGIDTIVIDHHMPLEDGLPDAYAIVNPKRKDSRYPFRELAAVGVVLKVAQALMDDLLEEELDLVALGTVADVVPLLDENRVFAKFGLKALAASTNPGIRAILETTGLSGTDLRAVSYTHLTLPTN